MKTKELTPERIRGLLEAMGLGDAETSDFWVTKNTNSMPDCLVFGPFALRGWGFRDSKPVSIEITDWRFVGRVMEFLESEKVTKTYNVQWLSVEQEVNVDAYMNGETTVIASFSRMPLSERILLAACDVVEGMKEEQK